MSSTASNPYEVLGIPPDSSFAQVRARYFQLARKHHPDKLHHLSEDERKKNEEYFQKISVAYSTIEKGYDPNTPTKEDQKQDHWRTIWSKVEVIFQRPEIWECMLHVLKGTLGEAQDDSRTTRSPTMVLAHKHHVKVPVSLQDLHAGKRKKLQLFLQGLSQPIHTHVHCKDYPKKHEFTTCIDGKNHSVCVEYNVLPHELFRLDDVLGTQDLYVDVHITWWEYICGVTKHIPFLDGTCLDVCFQPFDRVDYPRRLEGKGLAGKGDLYVSFNIQHITHQEWSMLSEKQQHDFLNILNALIHIRSGVEK
jgi:DnaJ like chaperone protein